MYVPDVLIIYSSWITFTYNIYNYMEVKFSFINCRILLIEWKRMNVCTLCTVNITILLFALMYNAFVYIYVSTLAT